MGKLVRTKWYKLVGDVYEYHGQDMFSKERTHTDVGWKLRSKRYGSQSSFFRTELAEGLDRRSCPLSEDQSGVYILRDSVFAQGFYIGKGKCMHSRIWKHGVKLSGTVKWNKAVESTKEFDRYRALRLAKGIVDLSDVEIAFWFTDRYDQLEDQVLGAYTAKYSTTPFCNSAEEAMFEYFDI